MEFFNKAKAVRFRSHLNKFLVADEDQRTIRQSRNGSSRKARWTVEMVEGKDHVIRLKSCHGKYLVPSDESFLLGVTGKKVVQDIPATNRDTSIEWEPIKEGGEWVKLRGKGGKFLRANGGTPPWRNSVTYDVPERTATQNWVLWEVEIVDIIVDAEEISSASSLSSSPEIRNDGYEDDRRLSSFVSNGGQSGMEFFLRAKAVRLQSNHGKYLVADEDEETIRQSRNGSSRKAHWGVEYVEGKPNVIRLKSCHGLYLAATDEPFLLGMTGKKVEQRSPYAKVDSSIEWEPIKEGTFVKLRTAEGKFLRANGGTPPWRNSVTHDIPHRTATQDWVLWGVDVVDISLTDTKSMKSSLSEQSSFSSVIEDFLDSPDAQSNMGVSRSFKQSSTNAIKPFESKSGMEFFRKAKSVRLKSHHDKFLLADEDGETVIQDRCGTVKQAKWSVEFVPDFDNVVRLKSCYGKYLTAMEEQHLLGVTGRKVSQTVPRKLDSAIEWEPIRDGVLVRLKTRYGNYLRANGGLPPWRNSITHDIPHRHHGWILWEIDIIERIPEPPPPQPEKVDRSETMNLDLNSTSFHLRTQPKMTRAEAFDDASGSRSDGRLIYYQVADNDGSVDNATEISFQFRGHGLEQLTQKLEEETGLENIIVCSRNPLNGKLYPLRLALPPNNTTMHIVVVLPTSEVARDFLPA